MYGRGNRQVDGRDGAMKWILEVRFMRRAEQPVPLRIFTAEPKRREYCLPNMMRSA